ncbi:MAG TPA: phosphate ABC transporter permease subunit PstC [Bacillota bacterium]|nr:phosphate ABC transporter permease subunit PstC [Bacillota bacterium]
MKWRNEIPGKWLSFLCAGLVIVLTFSIVAFIGFKGVSTFVGTGISPFDMLFSREWIPDRAAEQGGPALGILPFLVGSVLVSLIAVVLSAPLSIMAAFFISEIAPVWGRKYLQPAIELLAGIPSVVYGWLGLSLLVPLIRSTTGGMGFSLLAGALVLTVMIMPTIVSVSVDTIRSLPGSYKEAAIALGSTRWQVIRHVLLPAGLPGILTGIILGLSRAFGEALAVQMVIGNVRKVPESLFQPATTLTSGITMDMGYTAMGSLWNNALWSMALLLLTMSFVFIILIRFIGRRGVAR